MLLGGEALQLRCTGVAMWKILALARELAGTLETCPYLNSLYYGPSGCSSHHCFFNPTPARTLASGTSVNLSISKSNTCVQPILNGLLVLSLFCLPHSTMATTSFEVHRLRELEESDGLLKLAMAWPV